MKIAIINSKIFPISGLRRMLKRRLLFILDHLQRQDDTVLASGGERSQMTVYLRGHLEALRQIAEHIRHF